MQRSMNLAKTCFRPSNPLLNRPGSRSLASIVTRPMSSLSVAVPSGPTFEEGEVAVTIKKHNNSLRELVFDDTLNSSPLSSEASGIISYQLKPAYKFALPTEEDIRRYAVGLTRMKKGVLKPATSFEEVVLHFVTEEQGKVGVSQKVKNVLERKARVVQNKFGSSVVEWKYGF